VTALREFREAISQNKEGSAVDDSGELMSRLPENRQQ